MDNKLDATERIPPFRAFSHRLLRWMCLGALATGLFFVGGWLALRLVPLPSTLFAPPVPGVDFVDRKGQPLRTVHPDGGPFQRQVALSQIPQALIQGTLAAEDRRFWHHPGVDWQATTRAAWQLATNRRVISGGSTITQQLVKQGNRQRRTLRTKFTEAIQALRLEQVWDKQRILTEYLNRIDYGNFNSGCAAAAQFYFAKPLSDLSTAECALLAGLPQAPTRLNPFTHFDRARKRQQWILGQMRESGWLTENEFKRAAHEPLVLAKPHRNFEAPHFIDLVLQEAGPDDDGEDSHPLSGQIRTTLNLDLNRFAEQTLRRHVARLQNQQVHNGALIVIDNRVGEVLALVGSENYFAPAAGQVNGAWSPRSAGSTFKPFTYLLALEHGASPATVVADVPTEFATPTGIFAPVNYDRHCRGPVRYRVALANSLNIPAVKVLDSIGGAKPLQQLLQSCGLSTLTRPAEYYGLGLTIGNAETRLIELANAYACLARLGEFKPFKLLRDSPAPPALRVMGRGEAYLIADILGDNEARALAFGTETPLRFEFPVACKTGTSSGFRDNWAFGFTPEFTVGVWVGNFDGTPMRQVSGVTGAAPILHDVFEHLHEQFGTSWYQTPGNIVEHWVNPITGKRLAPDSPHDSDAVLERFVASAVPSLERPEDYDTSGRVRLGGEYRNWLATGENWLSDQVVHVPDENVLRILFPLPGTTFYLDPDLPDDGRRIHLQAEGPDDVEWQSDSIKFEKDSGRQIALLTKGEHCLTARNPRTGAQAQTRFKVLAR